MQKKRKVQDAFVEPKPCLSAFAAAKARAAQAQPEPSFSDEAKTIIADRKIQQNTAKDPTTLTSLLSSFPLSSAHKVPTEENDDSNGAGYSSDDQIWTERSSTKSWKSAQPRELSTFRPNKANILSNVPGRLVLKLKADENATFIGEYDLHVLSGIIVVYGAAIRAGDKPHRVFAPSTHALPTLIAKGGAAEVAIISTGLSMVGLNKLSPLWGRIWNARDIKEGDSDDETTSGRSFMLLRSSSDDPLKRALTALEMDQDIQSALSRLITTPRNSQPPPIILVSGPKGSGKSTISRWLTNTYLTSLTPPSSSSPTPPPKTSFWLDLDPGQPEFTPPGQLSLLHLNSPILSPPFTHAATSPHHPTSRLIRSHTLASVSPKEDPDHFLACAFDLLSHYHRLRLSFPTAPLIINCSGWVLGSAVDVLMSLVRNAGLSDVVLMSPMDPQVTALVEETLACQKQQGRVLVVPQRDGRVVQSRTSAESRAMLSMSYFHSLSATVSQPPSSVSETAPSPFPSSSPAAEGKGAVELQALGAHAKWDTAPLRAHHPWCVKYRGPEQGILGIASYGEIVNPHFLATVIDGMILAVCVIEDELAFTSLLKQQREQISSSYASDGEAEREDSRDRGEGPVDAEEVGEQGWSCGIESLVARTPENLPYFLPDASGLIPPLDPRFSRCLGLALVRGIDVANGELQLLTPISAAEIDECCGGEDGTAGGKKVVLVRGKFDSPDWAFLEDVFAGVQLSEGEGERERPYVAVRGQEAGGEALGGNVWRVRHLPRKMGGDGGGGGAA